MLLRPDFIRLPSPLGEFRVQVRSGVEAERVQMISRRVRLDSQKPGVFHAAPENEMADQVLLAGGHGCKRHPHLKRDARFLREDSDRPEALEERQKRVEEFPDFGILSLEMWLQTVPATGVALIAVGEASSALRAVPKRWSGRGWPYHGVLFRGGGGRLSGLSPGGRG